MAASISASIIACLKAFNAFVEQLQDLDNKNPARLLVQRWQDELGRLRMWAANIGAHQTNQSSLDYRLRDSSHVRRQIIKLLDQLLNRLHEAGKAILEEEVEDEDVESLEGSSSEDEALQTDVHQLQRSVATIITCLFQMSMLVRKPAQHDIRVGSRGAEVAVFEPFDYSHVRDKYPKAEDFVVSRLGQGLTRRRKYLKYRERHALKLKQGINNAVTGNSIDDNASETIATDVQNWNVRFDDNAPQSGISETSYAPTLMSGGDITIPAPPRSSHGGAPFECPYCYFIITAPSTRSWNRHVFDDLQPYMCLDKACTTPHKLYTTRHEWVHHSNTMHHQEDSLVTGCNNNGRSRNCILCGDSQATRQRYDRHVARHLQELALFVLPRNDEESDREEPSTESDTSSSLVLSEPSANPTSPGNVATTRPVEGPFWRCCECNSINGLFTRPESCPQCPHSKCTRCPSGPYHSNGDSPISSEENINDRGARSATSYEGSEEFLKNNSDESENTTFVKETAEEPYPRRGKTMIPQELVNTKALTELGYTFEHENDAITVFAALGKEHIDEIVELSKRINKLGKEVHDTSANVESSSEREAVDEIKEVVEDKVKIVDLARPTYIKVHYKHMLPDTLNAFGLPWEWEEVSNSSIWVLSTYVF
ncbi:MAG: hypothetical protein Q9201_004395 [Fulgogasparrea decipioides]